MTTIENLEARLAEIDLEGLPADAVEKAQEKRSNIQQRLAQLRLEKAESWTDQNWLKIIDGLFDELGGIVDKAVFRKKDKTS
ncbi:MAG TPA: hypothetical protein ENJ84_12340 [Gammaproteobacteria bacterium]|nr:hypothetical protein [Gammaproteobacteria bacterium]